MNTSAHDKGQMQNTGARFVLVEAVVRHAGQVTESIADEAAVAGQCAEGYT